MFNEIPWEQTADGAKAKLERGNDTEKRPKVLALFNFLNFLSLSVAKLQQVSIISADFQGETIVFKPYLGVGLLMGPTEEWLGMYRRDLVEDEEMQEQEHDAPLFCLRRAIWEEKKDISQFRISSNKREYVKEKGNINSHIIFGTPLLYPEITPMTDELERFVRQGIAIQAIQGVEFPWRHIKVDMQSDIDFLLEYSFNQGRNEHLESWIERWYKTFTQIDFSGGIIPDSGCFIRYSFPIEEVFERFST